MVQIRVRERNQLTLPMSIATAANIQPDDTLTVSYVNGVITLIPVNKPQRRRSIHDLVGIGKGVWGETPGASAAHFKNERDSWER